MQAVHDNLRNLAVERLDLVNFRSMGDQQRPAGFIQHLSLSNVTSAQIAEGRLRAPNVLLTPGASSVVHLKKNNAAANCGFRRKSSKG